MEIENNTNEEFKNKLFDFEEPVSDKVWKGINQKLNKPDKRRKRIIWWLPAVGLLLIGISLVFHKYVGSTPDPSKSASNQSQVQSFEKQMPQTVEKPTATEIATDLPVSESPQIIGSTADRVNNIEQKSEDEKPAQASEEMPMENSKSKIDKAVAQANLLPQMLSLSTNLAKKEKGNTEKKGKNSNKSKLLSTQILRNRKQLQNPESGNNTTKKAQSFVSKSGQTNEEVANAFQPEPNEKESIENLEKADSKSNLPSEEPIDAQPAKALTFGLEPFASLPFKSAEIKARETKKTTSIEMSLISVEIALAPTDTAIEKSKDSFTRKWHFGISVAALGAIQQVFVERNINEWNAPSLPDLSNIKNSPVLEGSIFASYSLTSRVAAAANVGLNTRMETMNFKTLSGTKSEFTLEPIVLPNAETSFQGNPINDQRFTQNLTTRFTTFWFQPKMEFKLAENLPIWLKPGYQIMFFNFQKASRAPGVNGPTFEVCWQKRHLEFGFKCLFFRQRDQIQFVPHSKVNSLWLGTSLGWRF